MYKFLSFFFMCLTIGMCFIAFTLDYNEILQYILVTTCSLIFCALSAIFLVIHKGNKKIEDLDI